MANWLSQTADTAKKLQQTQVSSGGNSAQAPAQPASARKATFFQQPQTTQGGFFGRMGNIKQRTPQASFPQDISSISARSVYGRLASMGNTPEAVELLNAFLQLQQDPTMPFYDPYTRPTNRAAESLSARGIDTSMLTSDWYKNNTGWQANLIYSGTTGTPTKPGKRATEDQLLAYDLYQYGMGIELTEKAQREWRAMQDEVAYKAKSGRYASEQAIIDSLDMNKYKDLQAMKDSLSSGQLLELNAPVGYSEDAIYGTIWAAMNGYDYTDDSKMMAYMAGSANGTGNQYHGDAAVMAKMEYGNAQYAPFTVGSTMDEERMYFGRDSFDQAWIDEVSPQILNYGSEEDRKHLFAVMEGVENKQKADEETGCKDRKGRRLREERGGSAERV